ncbi:MAG: hypothetical protein D3903_03560, partial [Candidatus Electrothrix sp. GM3_4]|nr:hypothetical protein [Candidatus Electrothrix sp. GM3_4]
MHSATPGQSSPFVIKKYFGRAGLMLSICKQLSGKEGQQGTKRDICGLQGGSAALFAARLQTIQQQTLCCLVPSDDLLDSLAGDIRLFTDTTVLTYPSFEMAPPPP